MDTGRENCAEPGKEKKTKKKLRKPVKKDQRPEENNKGGGEQIKKKHDKNRTVPIQTTGKGELLMCSKKRVGFPPAFVNRQRTLLARLKFVLWRLLLREGFEEKGQSQKLNLGIKGWRTEEIKSSWGATKDYSTWRILRRGGAERCSSRLIRREGNVLDGGIAN